ncbi:MAG: hypothetical protein ABIO70_25710 [Pseudomonadota bacterium]
MTPCTLLLALLLSAPRANAQVPLDGGFGVAAPASRERLGGAFGLGAAVGTPSGLTGKLWLGDTNAVQFAFGGRWGEFQDLSATGDFVLHFRPINVEGDEFSIPVYAGGGLKIDENFAEAGNLFLIGPRVVLGATVLVPTLPVDLYLEIAPTLYVATLWGWSMDGQVGARYYF